MVQVASFLAWISVSSLVCASKFDTFFGGMLAKWLFSARMLLSMCMAQGQVPFNGEAAVDYEGYQVCRFRNGNSTQVLEELIKPITMDYDLWTRNLEYVDIRLRKDDIGKSSALQQACEVTIDNVQKAIQDTYPTKTSSEETASVEKDFFFNEYRDLNTIYLWLDLLQKSFSHLVTIENIGKTFEGVDIKAIHISARNQELNPDKKTVVITGGVHAREWVSVTTACWTIYQLLTKYNVSRKETRYLDRLDFLIIPVFNPDGYQYTWTTDRLWRKNRQGTYWPDCYGIDIDHSFDYQWDHSEEFPCSEEYSGEEPFEALEAYHLNKYLNTIKSEYNIHGFLDLHSYSQEILYPYAYSCDATPRDLENLMELSYGLSKAFRHKSGEKYKVVSACEDRGSDLTPGVGSGSLLDYMYHHRAHWAFQLKLRDTGNHGFLLPAKYIRVVGRETYTALKYFCEFILDPEL